MEYLKSINDKLNKINEDNIEYIDLFEYPELFFGNINNSDKKLNFCKFSSAVQREMKKYGKSAVNEMGNLNSSSCGVRLRFKTGSRKLIFRVKLKRRFGYTKMINWGSIGFDFYLVKDGEYIHKTVFGPVDSKNIFAEKLEIPRNSTVCMFLPNYNTIEEMYLGLEKGSYIKSFEYPVKNRLPILFYGNSITQGASASRSSNAFPNLVSKKLNHDIINLSCSSCCRAGDNIAKQISQINCDSLVIDYSRNATNIREFTKFYDDFYDYLRRSFPTQRIILMTSAMYNFNGPYYEYDEVIRNTYERAVANGDNTKLLVQSELFDKADYDIISIDGSHYPDCSMNVIADKICELLAE